MASGNFELSLARLEEVAHRLERGDLPLEEGLALFEEGMQLARHCQNRLDGAETRIASLSVADDPQATIPTHRDG